MLILCELCQIDAATSLHHLIPRTLHSNKWFKRRYSRKELLQGVHLCGDCHRAVHRMVPSEKDLGRSYSSLEALRRHEKISGHVAWKRRRGPRIGSGGISRPASR